MRFESAYLRVINRLIKKLFLWKVIKTEVKIIKHYYFLIHYCSFFKMFVLLQSVFLGSSTLHKS